LLTADQIDNLVETIHTRSHGESRQATGAAANNLDLYQVNCTWYDALGRRDEEYLIARALQFFAPGIPQVYYAGLLAGGNDMDLLRRSGTGRDINRHYYNRQEIDAALLRPVVESLFGLMRFRNQHPAFAGEFHLLPCADHEIRMEWRNAGDWARLEVDLRTFTATIRHSALDGERCMAVEPRALNEVTR
jgi:sucrose phosphorylase